LFSVHPFEVLSTDSHLGSPVVSNCPEPGADSFPRRARPRIASLITREESGVFLDEAGAAGEHHGERDGDDSTNCSYGLGGQILRRIEQPLSLPFAIG
jgi:hypothetical protein